MVPSAIGSVIMVAFPFFDLSQTKLRLAVVLANAGLGDWVLCQITSNPYADTRAVRLENTGCPLGKQRFFYWFLASHKLCTPRQTFHCK